MNRSEDAVLAERQFSYLSLGAQAEPKDQSPMALYVVIQIRKAGSSLQELTAITSAVDLAGRRAEAISQFATPEGWQGWDRSAKEASRSVLPPPVRPNESCLEIIDLEFGSANVAAKYMSGALLTAAVAVNANPYVSLAVNMATLLGVNATTVYQSLLNLPVPEAAAPPPWEQLPPSLISDYGHALGREGSIILISPGPNGTYNLLQIEKTPDRSHVTALPLSPDNLDEFTRSILGRCE